MTVLQVCAYGAEYPGNFIASLEELESALQKRGIQTIYAFVQRAENKPWCKKIQERTKVYFLPEAKARILPSTYLAFKRIYRENEVAIVHSHFELYDIPATLMAPKGSEIFWHLHDPINFGHGARKILWKTQYGIVGKRAQLLAVAEYYRDLVVEAGFPKNQTNIVLNAVDLQRLKTKRVASEKTYDFLTFGWDFFRKGDDLILRACSRLEEDGYQFRFLLNGNDRTWGVLDEYLKGREPSWLERGNPVDDVTELFAHTRVFIQASRKETFAYGVCEAAYAGLPVICSEIAGFEWAHELPTVCFFPSEDVEGLYQTMKGFLDNRDVDESGITQTQRIIESNFSIPVWVEKIIKLYGIE